MKVRTTNYVHIPLKGLLEKDMVKGHGYADPYKNGLWI